MVVVVVAGVGGLFDADSAGGLVAGCCEGVEEGWGWWLEGEW